MEFEEYYELRFGRKPKLLRKATPPVPAQMWHGRAKPQCKKWKGEPSPGSDVVGVSPSTAELPVDGGWHNALSASASSSTARHCTARAAHAHTLPPAVLPPAVKPPPPNTDPFRTAAGTSGGFRKFPEVSGSCPDSSGLSESFRAFPEVSGSFRIVPDRSGSAHLAHG